MAGRGEGLSTTVDLKVQVMIQGGKEHVQKGITKVLGKESVIVAIKH